ncbi:glycosyltransferase [Vibrio astriarenae]|uniref:Glycosyltransferase n=1 Tax=Vibrio astriarenae TaxID=1481923 RepID=A0A7Z2T514_9VIBR|nr:glycosyltransferase family 2 protein [Vibrio astriarenae]QIA64461.1 glycosyltransferase [Vibrio astriarenae]
MKLYFSVVSHLHHDILIQLNTLKRLAEHPDIEVIFRDNIQTGELKQYCADHNIQYVSNEVEKGFATNNNLNYLLAQSEGMQPEDYFVLLNPDISIDEVMLNRLVELTKTSSDALMTVNLFLDEEKTLFDDNLRAYPRFINFIRNYVFGDRSTVIDKTQPTDDKECWSSAAFLVVKAGLYQRLQGLDETYFMYCEDIDFCLRASQIGERVKFVPEVEAIHYRHRCSQQFLSRAFFRHVKSVLLFTLAKHRLRRHKSILVTSSQSNTCEIQQH